MKLPRWLRASSSAADLLRSTGQVEIEARAGDAKPRLRILAYSGGIMSPPSFGPALIDLAGLDVPPRLNLLADHRATVEGVAGTAEPRVEAGQLVAAGTLTDATEAGRTIAALVKDGVGLQASVGAQPVKWRYVREGETVTANGRSHKAGPNGFRLVEKSVLKEISLLPLGADAATSAVAARGTPEGTPTMPETFTASNRDTTSSLPTEELRLQRIDALLRAGEWAGVENEAAELRASAISDGREPSALSAELGRLRALQGTRNDRPTPPNTRHGRTASGAGERDIAEAALLLMAGHESAAAKIAGGHAVQAARDLRLHSLAAWDDYNRRLVGNAAPELRAGFSTISLDVLMSSLPKMLLAEFEQAPASVDALADWRPLGDFKQASLYRLLISGGLEEIGPDGEIKHGSLTEFDARIKLATYAKMFQIPRQVIINDDVGALASIPRVLAQEASRLRGEKFAALLAANPGTPAFFSTDNDNLIVNVLDFDGLDAAAVALRTQTDADGRALNLTPTALLVGPSLEMTARSLVSSMELSRDSTGDNLPTGNPIRALNLRVEVEPRLATSTEWYLFSRPSDAAVVIGTLRGVRTPTIEQPEAAPNVLGQVVRGYVDYAFALAEHRAVVKSSGAGA